MTRLLDFVFSGILIVILLPFLIPIMFLLKLTGEHYIFYMQKRIGRYGKEFKLLKFATMLLDSPNLPGGLYTGKNDPRLLPMGKFLRKTKINELPQLINILCGEMSIVGYRPTVKEHFDSYPEEAKKKLYYASPGLTGIGSIVFRNEEDILQNFEDKKRFHQMVISPYKAALECWYIDHKNIFIYFMLIFMTAQAVLFPSSTFFRKEFKDLPPIPEELKPYI